MSDEVKVPDFSTMTHEEIMEWADAHMDWVIKNSTFYPKGEGPKSEFIGHENDLLQVTSVRLYQSQLTRLDMLAGRDRDGRSGLIRQAVDELLSKLTDHAA